jgi:hypothetical protein
MAHDHNGRAGPPRCEECNAPLNSDDRRSESVLARSLCLDCHHERYPFPRLKGKKWKRRLRAVSRHGSPAFSPLGNGSAAARREPIKSKCDIQIVLSS